MTFYKEEGVRGTFVSLTPSLVPSLQDGVHSSDTADYYAITKRCIIIPCFDSSKTRGEYYPVTTYEEFISKWEQLKLMSLL